MTPGERLELLEDLLAKVRRSARERGLQLPQDLPVGVFKQRAPTDGSNGAGLVDAPPAQSSHQNGALTAFTETFSGTHAPLALVEAPPPDPVYGSALAAGPALVEPRHEDHDDDSDDSPRTAVSISFAADPPRGFPQAPPLEPPPAQFPFEAAFEDETTSTGNPAEIEALAMAAAAEVITKVIDVSETLAPASPPARPLPQSVPPPQRLSSIPAVPLSLDDLDLEGLGTPDAAISVPPPAPLQAFTRSTPPAASEPAPAAAAFPTGAAPMPEAAPAASAAPKSEAAPADILQLDDADIADDELASTPPPPLQAPEAMATVRGTTQPPAPPDLDDDAPASQRQVRLEDRPLDDVLEGVSEPPPESGEVESQRYAKAPPEHDAPMVDEASHDVELPTPRPARSAPGQMSQDALAMLESTAEHHVGDVLAEMLVVDRPDPALRSASGEIQVASFRGSLKSSHRQSFGDIVDSALDL